jgi:hypothetical protein
VVLVMHQLLVMPSEPHALEWLDWTQDFVDNSGAVLALLRRYDHVRLSLHGHVHGNSLTTQHGIAFVSTAAAGEYPMHWREIIVSECEIELKTHVISAPALREKSRLRDSRAGRNDLKTGEGVANHVRLRICDVP